MKAGAFLDLLRASAVALCVTLLIPILTALFVVLHSNGDCLGNITAVMVPLSFTSIIFGAMSSWEWQRTSAVWRIATIEGRRQRLTARFCVIAGMGGVAALLSWVFASGLCPGDHDPLMPVVIAASSASLCVCFSSLGYVIGTLTAQRVSIFAALLSWSFLYLDPVAALPFNVLIAASNGLPYVYHFVPRGLELGFGLRKELPLLVVMHGVALYVLAWTVAGVRLAKADLPLLPWDWRARGFRLLRRVQVDR